jgi:DUF4097 and DUF4098 domain-containing protein YvlB
MSRMTLLALTAFVAAAPLAAQDIRGREGSTYTWSERMTAGSWLRVFDPNGRIDVSEASGDVAEVRAEKRAGSYRDNDIAFEIIKGRDGITFCTIFEGTTSCDEDGTHSHGRWRDNDGRRVTLTVRVPKGVKLEVSSGNGDVSVRDVGAEVRASSGNGRLVVSTAGGPVHASSGNGDVTVERAAGPVQAHSGNGRVLVATSQGPVSASSGNGEVRVSMDALSNTDEDMSFSTGNGRVIVTVPANFAGEIETSQGHGEFQSDFPMTVVGRFSQHHLRATIGKGGRRLTISSGNGDVELRKRG